jgi:hypothetical protein
MVPAAIAIPINSTGSWDAFWAVAAFLFGIIEYINYFWYRLSYGKSGFSIRLLLKTKPQKLSINKLIGPPSVHLGVRTSETCFFNWKYCCRKNDSWARTNENNGLAPFSQSHDH